MPDLAAIALFPPPGFIALATAALLGAFGYPRHRRFPAAVALAALSTSLTELQAGL